MTDTAPSTGSSFSIWRMLRSVYIPTSGFIRRASLRSLLQPFVRNEHEIYQTSSGMNVVEIRSSKDKDKRDLKTLVLMHGYGAGSGMFVRNFDDLIEKGFDRVIAIDWPGMGCSSRRKAEAAGSPSIGIFDSILTSIGLKQAADPHGNSQIDFYIDELERWRTEDQARIGSGSGSGKFVLAGHSLGGFLSARYCQKYPDNVSALVLISPAGMSARPPKESLTTSTSFSDRRWFPTIATAAWGMNITPQDFIRIAGPKGPGLVKSGLTRRLGAIAWREPISATTTSSSSSSSSNTSPQQGSVESESPTATATATSTTELDLLSAYLYHINAAPAVGEFALNALLEPLSYIAPETGTERWRVFARHPLNPSITQLGKHNVPILVLFGDNDWLDYPDSKKDVIEWQRQGVRAQHGVVRNGGHHFYLESPDDFHNQMVTFLKTEGRL